MREVPTSRISDLPRSRGRIPALLATPFTPPGRSLKDSPIAIAGVPGDFISQDDERLFAFLDALRVSVKARVAVEQLRGGSLSEIVVQVREMVRLAEQEAQDPKLFSPRALRAISRQAVAWCIEAYQPPVFLEAHDEQQSTT